MHAVDECVVIGSVCGCGSSLIPVNLCMQCKHKYTNEKCDVPTICITLNFVFYTLYHVLRIVPH